METSNPAPKPRPCRLCIVRHGETSWNAERRLQGHLDIALNDTGIAQAGAVARRLAGERFAALYCSDLRRARDTAAAAGLLLSLEAQADPRLRERNYGVFEGLTYEEAELRHPDAYRRFQAREPGFAFPGGGESLAGVAARVAEALTAIARRHAGEQVLVFTHGGVLDIVHRLTSGKSLDAKRDFLIPNGALNWIDYDDGWHLVAWADASHLERTRDELPNA
jgi:probable phosphoglycerate mutase